MGMESVSLIIIDPMGFTPYYFTHIMAPISLNPTYYALRFISINFLEGNAGLRAITIDPLYYAPLFSASVIF